MNGIFTAVCIHVYKTPVPLSRFFVPVNGSTVHPYVVDNGARRPLRFDAARSPALAEFSKFVGSLTLKRPERRAPTNRQIVDALTAQWILPGRG